MNKFVGVVFEGVQLVKNTGNGQDESMARSEGKWEPIMRFWSQQRAGEVCTK